MKYRVLVFYLVVMVVLAGASCVLSCTPERIAAPHGVCQVRGACDTVIILDSIP